MITKKSIKINTVGKNVFVFDLDDTLRLGVNSTFLNTEQFEYQISLPGVISTLSKLKEKNSRLFIASNQGSPSFPGTTEYRVWRSVIFFIENILGEVPDDVKLDFYHPKGAVKHRYVDRRKPRPDLILELSKDYGIKLDEMVYIGNAPSDESAAANAGISFIWAHDFFGWNKHDLEIDKKFGYQWKISALKDVFAEDSESQERLRTFVKLVGPRYRGQLKR